tara:strand:- start:755 stop:1423 length:669 start_codon:yes stop_codon:yes gene_type:complete
MNFQNNLTEFNFNLETLDLLKNENLNNSEIIDILIEAGFDSELTKLLLELNRSYLNGILVRLKLYNKLNKSKHQVINNLKDYQNLKPLIHKLFHENENLSLKEIKIINNLNKNVNEEVLEEVQEEVQEEVEEEVQVEEVQEEEIKEDDEYDFYENFFMECLEGTNNKKDKVKSKEVYNTFKKWYSKNYSLENIPSKTDLKNFLNNKLGKSVKSSWSSVKLVV